MSKHTPAVDVSHLHAYDTDGAIREAEHHLNRALSRRSLLRGAGVAAGGAAVAGLLPGSALAAGFGPTDKAIMNFALTLEYLEAAFYARSLEHAGLSGSLQHFAKVVSVHEKAHVQFLQGALGSSAVARPSFDFGAATRSPSAFTATSIVLEDTGVQAYQGQAANIHSDALLAAALSVHPVEARHASWIRYLAGQNPAPAAFNPALTKSQVLAAVTATGFIKA